MRELTPEEESFVRARKSENSPVVEKKKTWVRFPPVHFLVGAIALVPFLFTASFLYGISRLEGLVDRETIEVITSAPGENAEAQNWIDEISMLYDSREIIIAGAFTASIVIIVIILLIEYYVNRKRTKKELEENA